MYTKLAAVTFGWLAIEPDGSGVFDAHDEAWVLGKASPAARVLRVAPDLSAAWVAGDGGRPWAETEGVAHFAGEEVAAMILAGRDEALSQALGAMPGARAPQH